MKTVIQQLLELIPDAAQIKQYMSENEPDEKMLDEWLWERIFKGRDWKAKEREQIVEAYNEDLYGGLQGRQKYNDGNDYFNRKYNNPKQ